jgi:hypothetical protein
MTQNTSGSVPVRTHDDAAANQTGTAPAPADIRGAAAPRAVLAESNPTLAQAEAVMRWAGTRP